MTKSSMPKSIVVYADDDQDDILLLEHSFSEYSSNVDMVTFMEGSHVLSYLENLTFQEPSPCLVILDINMPGLNGKEVLIRLRDNERYKNIPVVLFSTSSLPGDRDFARKYDAGFITKPLQLDQMKAITDEFIEHCTEDHKKNIRSKNNI